MQGRSLSSFLPLVADLLEHKYKDHDAADIVRAAHKELTSRNLREVEKTIKNDTTRSLLDLITADIPKFQGDGLRVLPFSTDARRRKDEDDMMRFFRINELQFCDDLPAAPSFYNESVGRAILEVLRSSTKKNEQNPTKTDGKE